MHQRQVLTGHLNNNTLYTLQSHLIFVPSGCALSNSTICHSRGPVTHTFILVIWEHHCERLLTQSSHYLWYLELMGKKDKPRLTNYVLLWLQRGNQRVQRGCSTNIPYRHDLTVQICLRAREHSYLEAYMEEGRYLPGHFSNLLMKKKREDSEVILMLPYQKYISTWDLLSCTAACSTGCSSLSIDIG